MKNLHTLEESGERLTLQELAKNENIKQAVKLFKALSDLIGKFDWRIRKIRSNLFHFNVNDLYLDTAEIEEIKKAVNDSYQLDITRSWLSYRLYMPPGATEGGITKVIKALIDNRPELLAVADEKMKISRDRRAETSSRNKVAANDLVNALIAAFPQYDLKDKLEIFGGIVRFSITRYERYMNRWDGYKANEEAWSKQCKMFNDLEAWCKKNDVDYDIVRNGNNNTFASTFTTYLKMKATSFNKVDENMKKINENTNCEESVNKSKITLNSLKRMLIESIADDEAGEEAEQDADDAPVSGNENLEDVLNSLLGDEYNAWKQYTMMTIAAKGKSLARVEEVFKNAGNEEMYDHFENLYKWMQSTGMKPVNDPDELNKICGCPFVKVEREQDTVSLVDIAVKAENAAIDAYSKALEMDVVKAYPDLVYLLSEFLKDERGHLRELQDVQTQMNGFDGNGPEEEEVTDDAE